MDLTEHVELKALTDRLDTRRGELSAAEATLLDDISGRLAVPGETTFDDKICLEVMLRNIEIRKQMAVGPDVAEQSRELPRKD